MKKLIFKNPGTNILMLILAFIVFSGCSTVKQYNDDAVRIKPDSLRKPYATEPQEKFFFKEPNTGKARNANTLRGRVLDIRTIIYNDSTGKPKGSRSYLIFVDSLANSLTNPQPEEIPLDYIDLMGPKVGLSANWFENYNSPLDPKAIREVPIDTVVVGVDSVPINNCNCNPPWEIKCPCGNRKFTWSFLELRLGYASYSDRSSPNGTPTGTDGLFGEVATGFRFSGNKSWGAGLAYSTGIPMYNTYTNTRINRPTIMLHLRKSFDPLVCCIVPFIYGQFGLTVDKFSLDLFNTVTCTDCKSKINVPGLDLGLPLSYGIGAGIDFPILPFMDVSMDIAFRSIGFGESQALAGFSNAPSLRRVNMLVLRFGLTY